MIQTIQLQHPQGKQAVRMDQGKYEAVRAALLKRLKTKGESTHNEILHSILDDFDTNHTVFDGSVPWHMEWVKLDLEARKAIKRVGTRSSVKFALA